MNEGPPGADPGRKESEPVSSGAIIYTKRQRKDGKIPVTIVYPLNGTSLSKLLTPQDIEAYKAQGYAVKPGR